MNTLFQKSDGTAVAYVLTNPYEFGGNPRATFEPGLTEHEELRIEEHRCIRPRRHTRKT